jgi:hypothetical protein
MKKISFASIPTLVALTYMVVEFMFYWISGKMLFSNTFSLEWGLYAVFGVLYLFIGFGIGRFSYLWPALLGLIVGLVIFTAIGFGLFLHFEFAQNLSI